MTRYEDINQGDAYGNDLTTLGFPASLARAIDRPGMPSVSVSGYTSYGGYDLKRDVTEVHFAHAGMMKQWGRQSIRTGFSARLNRHRQRTGRRTGGRV